MRRKVVKRALNALGQVSGMCGILNGEEQMKELREGLKFDQSYEQVRHAEQERKKKAAIEKKKTAAEKKKRREQQLAKTREKMSKLYDEVLEKLGATNNVLQRHVAKLSIPQLKVCVCVFVWCMCMSY